MRGATLGYVLGMVIIALGIAAVILVTILVLRQNSSYTNCKYNEVPYSMSITRRDEDVLLSWYELSPNDECNISYKLHYWINNGSATEVNVTQMYYTLPLLETCSTLFVLLWVMSNEGIQSDNFTSKSYFEVPEKSAVTDVEFTNLDNGLDVTWSKLTSLSRCDISYQTSMRADIGALQYVETETEFLHIPHLLYCLQINLTINTVVNDLILDTSATAATYHDQEEIKDIEIEPSTDDNTKVIVSWAKHIKHYWCSLKYNIEYINEDGNEQTKQTEGLTATFDVNYCSSSSLTISAHNTLAGTSSPKTSLESTLEPTAINPVINVYFSQDDDKKEITWGISRSFQKCNLEYKLDFITDLGNFSSTTNATTFEVPEEMYCSSLQFKIQAVYGDVSSDPVVSAVYTFENPASLRSVQTPIVSVSATNEAIISWDSPTCTDQDAALEYIITAKNEYTNEQASCNGYTNCTLNLDNFCPQTDFTIHESSGIIRELTISHNCS